MITSLGILSVGQLWFALTKTVPLNSHTCLLNIDLHFLWSHVLSCLELHTQTGNNVTYVPMFMQDFVDGTTQLLNAPTRGPSAPDYIE